MPLNIRLFVRLKYSMQQIFECFLYSIDIFSDRSTQLSFKILIFSNRSDEFRSFNFINVFLSSFLARVEDFFELV